MSPTGGGLQDSMGPGSTASAGGDAFAAAASALLHSTLWRTPGYSAPAWQAGHRAIGGADDFFFGGGANSGLFATGTDTSFPLTSVHEALQVPRGDQQVSHPISKARATHDSALGSKFHNAQCVS